MASTLSVTLTGDLNLSLSAASCPTPADTGCSFALTLASSNKTGTIEQSNKPLPVDASGGAVALPFPVGLTGKVIYLKVLTGGPLDVSVTHATQGATVYPVKSTFLLEVSDDELISAVSITTGSGTIEWVVWGN